MMNFDKKQKRILSITLAIGGIFLISSGIIMNSQIKPITHTTYGLKIEKRKIAETQAKTNEIKVKDFEIEINNPISVDIKDYIEEIENLSEETIKSLKLDTSLVNISQAGIYQYTVTYKKKKYIGNRTVKEKEISNLTITLKEIHINTGESLPSVNNATELKYYINETIPEEIISKIRIEVDISEVNWEQQGDYTYYVKYGDVVYQGKVIVRDPGITTKTSTCPPGAIEEENDCKCQDGKVYDKTTKSCIEEINADPIPVPETPTDNPTPSITIVP